MPTTALSQRHLGQDLVKRPHWLQKTLEIHQLLHVGMEIGLLLDGLAHLQEKLLVDQLFDAANGEVRHKVLTVTEIAQVVKGVQKVGFEVKQGLGLIVHAEPKHTRHVVAAKKPRSVKVQSERLRGCRQRISR